MTDHDDDYERHNYDTAVDPNRRSRQDHETHDAATDRAPTPPDSDPRRVSPQDHQTHEAAADPSVTPADNDPSQAWPHDYESHNAAADPSLTPANSEPSQTWPHDYETHDTATDPPLTPANVDLSQAWPHDHESHNAAADPSVTPADNNPSQTWPHDYGSHNAAANASLTPADNNPSQAWPYDYGSHDTASDPSVTPADVDLGRVWLQLAAEVWRREPGRLERVAARLLRSPGLARALVTTPSLLLGWVTTTVLVLGVGALAGRETGTPYVALLAPAIAAGAIAYAYGPGTDPAWELTCSMAVSDRMVLLVRALTVFALNALLGLAASIGSGVADAVTFGWLVPMTAVCLLALAVATLARSANAGVLVGLAGWALAVLIGQSAAGQFTPVVADSALILPYLAFAACCGAVLLYAIHIPRRTQ